MVSVFRSSPVKNPHPLRAQQLATGRSEPSPPPPFYVREFVDVEKALFHIWKRKRRGESGSLREKPLVDFSTLVQVWRMFCNDRLGCCTVASVAHGLMVFFALIGMEVTITDADIERMYEQSGWRPGDPSTDQGWTLQAAAEYMMKTGLLGKPEIEAFAGVNIADDDEQQIAMELFGGLSTGIQVPESAMSEFQEGRPWTIVPGSPIVGGHAIWKALAEVGRRAKFLSWGAPQEAVERWEKTYVDEYLAFVPVEWEQKMPLEVVELGVVDFSKLASLVASYQATRP